MSQDPIPPNPKWTIFISNLLPMLVMCEVRWIIQASQHWCHHPTTSSSTLVCLTLWCLIPLGTRRTMICSINAIQRLSGGLWKVFDFPLTLLTLKKASFQGFGSRLLVDILFRCWDPTLAHSASITFLSPLLFADPLAHQTHPSPLLCSLPLPPPNKCLNINICESPTLFASIYPIKMWFYQSKQVLWTPPLPLPSLWHLPHNYHICSLLFPPPFPPYFPLPIPFDMSSPYVHFFDF